MTRLHHMNWCGIQKLYIITIHRTDVVGLARQLLPGLLVALLEREAGGGRRPVQIKSPRHPSMLANIL
jgi:hypothetical protein